MFFVFAFVWGILLGIVNVALGLTYSDTFYWVVLIGGSILLNTLTYIILHGSDKEK